MQVRYMEEILNCESGESLEQVSQRRYRCPNPGSVPGQVGQSIEQPGLMEMSLLKADDLLHAILCVYMRYMSKLSGECTKY